MRRSFAVVLSTILLALCTWGTAGAAEPGGIVRVTFPKPAATDDGEHLDFWTIPWQPGAQLTGSFQVQTAAPVRNLTVRPVTGATSLDATSRRAIPKNRIIITRADETATAGDTGPADGPGVLDPGDYLFSFVIDGVPGEDTYLARLEATGEVQDANGEWRPFVEPLPALKLRAFAEPEVRIITGRQLRAQWVNLKAPWALLRPIQWLLDTRRETYHNRHNPNMLVAITMPGRHGVETTQQFRTRVTMGPLLDEQGNEAVEADFWLQSLSDEDEEAEDHLEQRDVLVRGNDTLVIGIYRDDPTYLADEADPKSEVVNPGRILPGTYKSTLRIETEWGTVHEFPIEISVRDHPAYAVASLVAGILISLLAGYWQNRQPIVQAQQKARRWETHYENLPYKQRIPLVDRVLMRLHGCILAGDAAGATQSAQLLESLMRDLPATMALDEMVGELDKLAPDSSMQFWSLVTAAPDLGAAFDSLKRFCQDHSDPAVQALAARPTTAWTKPGPEDARTSLLDMATNFVSSLKGSSRRLLLPNWIDILAMTTMFVLVNGFLVAVQLSQSYGQNETFGAGSDYMNLLLWGFAGDATRMTLTDLAGRLMPSRKTNPAGSGQ